MHIVVIGALLFFLATYVRSRGHSPRMGMITCVIAVIPTFLLLAGIEQIFGKPIPSSIAFVFATLFPFIPIGFAFLYYAIRPPAEGAPGKAYYTITFSCSECGETINERRETEGRAILCPHCDEITSVPYDDNSTPHVGFNIAEVPPKSSGPVLLRQYHLAVAADTHKIMLESNGIRANVFSDNTGLEVATGSRLFIDASDWVAARAILSESLEAGFVMPDEVDNDLPSEQPEP